MKPTYLVRLLAPWTILIAVWSIAATNLLSVPSIPQTLEKVAGVAPDTIYALSASIPRALLVLGLGTVAGTLCAITAQEKAWLHQFFHAIGFSLFVLPIIVAGPILSAFWHPDVSIIVLGFMIVFLPAYQLIYDRVKDNLAHRKALTDLYADRVFPVLREIAIPASSSSFFAVFRVCFPWSLLGVLLGEYLGATNGLGIYLLGSLSRADPSSIWATCAILIAIFSIVHVAALRLEKQVLMLTRDSEESDSVVLASNSGLTYRLIAPALFLLFVWETLRLMGWSHVLVPDIISTVSDRSIVTTTIVGLGRSTLTALLGLTLSIALALSWAVGADRVVGKTMTLFIMPFQLIPILIAIPLLVSVFGRGDIIAILICALATVLPIYSAILAFRRSIPKNLDLLLDHYSTSYSTRVFHYERFWVIAGSIRGLRAGAPRAILGVMLAEALVTGNGLGWLVFHARAKIEYNTLWFILLAVVIVSSLVDFALAILERRVLAGYRSGSENTIKISETQSSI